MFGDPSHIYRFGDGRKSNAIYSLKIPAVIGSHAVETDVVNNDFLLLFSKASTKKGKIKLKFQNGTINIFNENIPPNATNSGDNVILITKSILMINNLKTENDMGITFSITDNLDNHNVALKLHQQFAHLSQENILQLTNNAGQPWCINQTLKEEIKNKLKKCTTWKLYK